MAKKIMITLHRPEVDDVEQKLEPEHADALVKLSKFWKIKDDPRDVQSPPKEKRADKK